jgi:2-polyprenyl-3-methyl-5-hydroxy-6-metoxy-1,4-benzoquinol methylase
MNIFNSIRFFYSRKILPGFKIDKDALVVDIGSGDKPFWRADVFVDKLSLGNVQRASHTNTIHNLGTFVDSDATKMPFKDGAFDFSFCSHLLEHVENPSAVIKEITRISRSGYMEIPNGILETIKPFDSHLWFVYQNKKKLIFVRKSEQMHDVLIKNGEKYKALLNKISEPFIKVYWRKEIDHEIVDIPSSKKFKSKVGNIVKPKTSVNFYILLVKIVRLVFYKNKSSERIAKLIK